MKCRGSLWVGEIASQSGLSRTCRGAGGRKPEGRAERSCAAASAQVQGWKLPDRRAEHASSLPSHQRPARQRGSGRNPAETGAPLPDDAFRGHRTPAVALPGGRRAGAAASRSRAAALGWVGAAESLHPQQSCRIQAGSSQPAPEQGSRGHSCKHRPQLTAPHCTAQHSTAQRRPRLLCSSHSSWCHQPGPHIPGDDDGPWGVSQPPEPEGPCPQGSTSTVPAAAQPRAQLCCAG